MATPDVRVRLTAEGVAEVVAALRKIRQESDAAAKNTGRSFLNLNGILSQSQRLFGTLGVAVGAGALVALARNAANAADELDETAQAIGTNVVRLSALSTIAQQAGIEVTQLRQALGLTADKVTELREGNEQAEESFGKLGLRAQDFAGKDTAEAFDLIASRLGRMETGLQKTGIAADLFGTKIGPRLIPLLNQLADGGLTKAEQAARELGTVLDEDVVAAAGRVSDETNVMGQQINAVATVLVAELQPAFSDTFQIAGEGLRDLQDGIRDNGDGLRALAGLLNLIGLLAQEAIDLTISAVRELFTLLGGAAAVAAVVLSGNANRAKFVWERTLSEMETQLTEFQERAKRRSDNFDAILAGRPLRPPTRAREDQPGAGQTGTGNAEAESRKKLAQQAQLERALLDNALKLRQASRRAEEADAKRAFDQGLTTLADYYARRREIAEKGAADEIAALKARAAIEERLNKDPASRAVNLANIAGEIDRRTIEGEEEKQKLLEEERLARQRANEERLDFEQKILNAQGRTHEAALANIEAEARAFEQTVEALGGAQSGFTPDDLREVLAASAEFDRQVSEFHAELRALESERASLQAQVAAGQVSELTAQKQLIQLEQARVPTLTEIARLATAAAVATGDPEKIQQARELTVAIEGLGTAASESTLMLRNMGQTIGGVLTNELTAFLSGGADGFKSLKDAALDAIGSIIQALRRLLAQLLATKLIEFLGLGFSGGGKVAIADNPGVPLPEFAGGGPIGGRTVAGRIFGPGTGTSDSVFARMGKSGAWLSKDEHVMTAEVSNRPGYRQLFDQLNAGLKLEQIIAPPPTPRTSFAEGGAVGSTSSSARIDGNVTIGLEDGLVSRGIESKAGQEAILRVLSRRSKSARRALGGSF